MSTTVLATTSGKRDPDQGIWTEAEYLALTGGTNRLIEFTDGRIEVLPMPKASHQRIVRYLSQLLTAFVTPGRLGEVLFAPLRVRLENGRYREPDIVFMLSQNAQRAGEDYWDGADLVVEVVSEDVPERDLVQKRAEYAAAGISEYWIVNPQAKRAIVLRLADAQYAVHGEFAPGDVATSSLLTGLRVDVTKLFAAAASAV